MKGILCSNFVIAVGSGLLSGGSSVEAASFRIGAHKFAWGSWDVVADRLGYFKEAGLKNYCMKVFKSGKAMRNAIIQNNIDI